MAVPQNNARAAVEAAVRADSGKILAALIHQFSDIQLAEDALQEAVVVALERWPRDGTPDRPAAWLIQTARRKAIDRLRREQNFKRKQPLIGEFEETAMGDWDFEEIPDERLRLIFTCCHPALSRSAQVALTLKTLCGLTTAQVGSAFLVPEITMAQRLVRAKRKIKSAGIPYVVPAADVLPQRVDAVLSVVYLIFNEGYRSSQGAELVQAALCDEAIHLGKMLLQLLPKETEVIGLLALMYFHHARYPARLGHSGHFVSLQEQDRSLWDRQCVKYGDELLHKALMMGRIGPYQIQAAISAIHDHADSYADTDWSQIALLYQKLYELQPTPVVTLNQAVAISYAKGAEHGLKLLEGMPQLKEMADYQPYYAAKADILHRAKHFLQAIETYRRAIELTHNGAERRYLENKLATIRLTLADGGKQDQAD